MKDESFISKDKILQLITQEEQEPHAHKPFMAKVPVKATPIGYEFHQIEVPDFEPQKALRPSRQRKIIWENIQIEPSVPVYLCSNVNEEEAQRYLSFVENYLQQKIPDYFIQSIPIFWEDLRASAVDCFLKEIVRPKLPSIFLTIFIILASRERTRTMALQLLHQSGYNYTQAKFYILFPYYKTYNTYKCHQPLVLSNEQMQHKINVHIENLKSSKQNDLMKWVKTIENQMQSRIHISKINTYMQIARQNKYDIPDSIKDIIEKSMKIGKQIKKNILNSKNTLEKLQSIKAELQDHKIVTNEMIHFEEAVTRAEEWIKKQVKFQEEYFWSEETEGGDTNFTLKDKQFFKEFGKIEYRTVQSLVNEYNSLPLNYPAFAKTTQIIYEQTNKLISKIPSLSKAAKTRKSEQGNGVVKLPRKFINEILWEINEVPVQHEDFINFEYTITDGLQQLERISMFLQDTKFEKSIKTLYQYQKFLCDIPIENDVQSKLNQKIEYYELIDRIKKDISNPMKYESLKDQLLRLKEKGYESVEHAKLESRVMTCMGWHESQQLIKEEKKIPNRTFIILQEKAIRAKMIKFESFQAQLFSARNELNISEDILKESEERLELVGKFKTRIQEILNEEQPSLWDFVTVFKACYENGISFLEFEELYQKLGMILVLVAKMIYLLSTSDEIMHKHSGQFYFTQQQSQKVLEYMHERRYQIQQLRTKQTGDQIIQSVENMSFPTGLAEWKQFQEFMRKAQEWSDMAMKIIEDFKNNNDMYNTREVIQQSRHCLHSRMIEDELNKIEIALKWREKIARKMVDEEIQCFDQEDHQFMEQLVRDLQQEQLNFTSNHEDVMFRALEYMHAHSARINSILEKIASYPVEKIIVLKLSEMNKFVKEIDKEIEKYQIKDKVIDQLKAELQIELVVNEDWKERYLAIKRFQKKKIVQNSNTNARENSRKRDDDEMGQNEIEFDLMKDDKEEEVQEFYPGGYIPKAMMVSYSPVLLTRPHELFQSQKKKYYIKNGEFCLYYRMLLMILEFYNGCRLKFFVEEFIKLKNTLSDIYRLIQRYNYTYEKADRTDIDFEYLESESCKIPIFFKESYLATNKYAQIMTWKTLADHLLRSVPVINMELKARRIQDLKELFQKKKNEEMLLLAESRMIEEQANENTSKRRRKPNQLYENDDITLFRDDILISKNKKRKPTKPQSALSSSTMAVNEDHHYNSRSNPKKGKQEKQLYKDQKQSLERIEQLINTNPELIIEDPKAYCICRNGVLNENSLMVNCEQCDEWYHIECVGIKKHQAKSDQSYLCVACKSLSDEYESNFGYFWDHHQKITEYALTEIYEEGKSLQVSFPELNKITQVYNAMIKWKEETNNLLRKIVEENPSDLSEWEEQISPLYLQSMWLPTIHYEALHLKTLMKHIRNVN